MPAPSPSPARTEPAAAASSFNGWPWAILVGIASLLWGALFSGPPSPWSSVPAPPRLMAGSTDVAGEMDTTLKSLYSLMTTIRDRNTAETALPQFRAAQSTFERLEGAAKQLGTNDKRVLAGYVSSWLPVVTQLMTGLSGNTTAGPVVKPILDTILGKLQAFTKT